MATRQVRFMIGQEFFWTLNEAMKHKRKHGGEIRQVYSTVIEKSDKRPRHTHTKTQRVDYDPTAPLPDEIAGLL